MRHCEQQQYMPLFCSLYKKIKGLIERENAVIQFALKFLNDKKHILDDDLDIKILYVDNSMEANSKLDDIDIVVLRHATIKAVKLLFACVGSILPELELCGDLKDKVRCQN